jgi:uncharacterized protein YbjT (DUF2867 family)
MKSYVITGATGNIGKIVANELLAKGEKVKVIGRNADKLKEFTSKGAEALIGDVTDTEFVKKAFAGATAVFCMIPPSTHSSDFKSVQRKIATNYRDAVKTNAVKHVILLSSIGAHLRNGAGIVDELGEMEELFHTLKDVNILNLRPTYFMENVFGQIGTIKQMGFAGSAVKPDVVFPIVASKDIAAVIVKRLTELQFKGNTIEYVLGQRDVTYNEITTIIGKAIGKTDLKYVHFSNEDAKKGMVMSGYCSENVADLMIGLSDGMNNGKVLNAHKRTTENTTPTSLEDFSKIFALAFQNS